MKTGRYFLELFLGLIGFVDNREWLFLVCKWGFWVDSCFLNVDKCLLVCVVTGCCVRGYGFTLRV